jgi:hypothetical protein
MKSGRFNILSAFENELIAKRLLASVFYSVLIFFGSESLLSEIGLNVHLSGPFRPLRNVDGSLSLIQGYGQHPRFKLTVFFSPWLCAY